MYMSRCSPKSFIVKMAAPAEPIGKIKKMENRKHHSCSSSSARWLALILLR